MRDEQLTGRFVRSVLLLALVALILVLHPAYAQAASTLTGERLFATERTPGFGQVTLQTSCDPNGVSTVSYTATGPASGPYPGTFEESGTATIGPQDLGRGTHKGEILSFEASFTIDSPAGQVSGIKFLAEPGFVGGTCLDTVGASEIVFLPIGCPEGVPCGGARYDAQIVTDAGRFRDRGETRVAVVGHSNEPVGDNTFEEEFNSDLLEPEPLRPGEGCGDRNHAHEREGECRNPPR